MFVMVLRIILLALFAYCIYAVVKYVANPKRRLKLAQSKEHFYIIDEQNNTRKNFQLTYKGVLLREKSIFLPRIIRCLFTRSLSGQNLLRS